MSNKSSGFCAEIEQLLSKEEMFTAIDRLKTAFDGAGARQLYDAATLLNSRLSAVERSYRQGKSAENVYHINRLKMAEEVLALCSDGSDELSKVAETEAPRNTLAFPSIQDAAAEKILGIENLKQISWIELAVLAARPVCRIFAPNNRGTGFLLGGAVAITNNHVLPTKEAVRNSFADFNYQLDAGGGFHQWVRYRLLDDERFHTSSDLDYTLVGVEAESHRPPPDSWGRVTVNVHADPVQSEHVSIIQHPMGGYKQIALTNNAVVDIKAPFLYYTTDTMPGSSGSPVFNDSWQAVALHRAHRTITDSKGNIRYANEGVLLSAIKEHAGAHWPGTGR